MLMTLLGFHEKNKFKKITSISSRGKNYLIVSNMPGFGFVVL